MSRPLIDAPLGHAIEPRRYGAMRDLAASVARELAGVRAAYAQLVDG
jgi:hypothetical protein